MKTKNNEQFISQPITNQGALMITVMYRDLMSQLELVKFENETEFAWSPAACIITEARITLGTLMANQLEFERQIQAAFDEDAIEKINEMIAEELK